jgi:hypothetical protein
MYCYLQGLFIHTDDVFVLFHHHKQLTECISEVERTESRVNSSKKKEKWLTTKKEEVPTSPDDYLIKNNSNL